MTGSVFLENCLLIDLETTGDCTLYRIGACFEGERFERSGKFDRATALAELDRFAEGAEFSLLHHPLFPILICPPSSSA